MDKRLREVLEGKGENYILPFFWQHGEEEEVLRDEMKRINESGIGAVCVEARPHPDFAGPLWWRDMDIIMDEARQRGMRVWVLDDAHFPTGFANGHIRDKYHEKGKKYLTIKSIDADGPLKDGAFFVGDWLNRFDWMNAGEKLYMDDELFAVVATRRSEEGEGVDGTLIDMTSKVCDGILYWDLPEGPWRIFTIIITRSWGGNPDYINIIDADSVRVLIDAVHEPHYVRYKEDFGGTFAGFFSDEPSFGNTKGFNFDESIGRKNMVLPWSKDVEVLLKKEFGSEFKRLLPCLWSNAVERTWEVRYKYMNIVSWLYSKNFAGQIGEWCKKHNVEYIGHVIEDQNVHARLGCGAGHFFRALWGQHMSGIDVIGQQVLPRFVNYTNPPLGQGPDNEFFHFGLSKLGSSLGHIDPKKKGRTICEIFGASGWASGVKLNKWMVDHVLVRGINHIVPHAFSAKEFPDRDCPPHFYARGRNPQFRYFKHLMEYTNRMCHLLNGGLHIAPVAVLYHAEAEWSGEYMYFQKPAHRLANSQIDHDILPSDIFSNMDAYNAGFGDGKLYVNGEAYRCLVIPYSQNITKDLAQFIANAKGFEVIFINDLPEGICGEPDPVRSRAILEDLKDCRVTNLESLAEELRSLGIYDISLSDEEPYLRYYHYRRGDTDIYMFFNEHPVNHINTIVSLKSEGKLFLYNAFDNKLVPLNGNKEGNTTSLLLKLSCYESAVIISGEVDNDFFSELTAVKLIEAYKNHKEAIIEGKWKVSLAASLEYPDFTREFVLDNLVNMSSPDYFPDFSGTFRYITEFNMDIQPDKAVIELGRVFEVADVQINGQSAGIRICPPYSFDIGRLLKLGVNTLQIDVTNTLIREVRDPMSTNMAIDPSGLLGPVKIRYNMGTDLEV
ncbi:alpha-L-rhamnosidase-like protein [Anaerobacterium chartisolvens]|uniref:Alpha-L-rhamnosidase-like protein n=1 Tax=Anaerobacterium chartisolvens TaxID=1297424 RepID=A0A369AKN0_9FIRM|nr:glycosylhydrolase-like jelly roll fold domain-containing protein [Anaerobacterium chartisolvens]RCX09910.1 alpha-L-rhamnosidase-like protein [Anaerobacterium chartisolvens]